MNLLSKRNSLILKISICMTESNLEEKVVENSEDTDDEGNQLLKNEGDG